MTRIFSLALAISLAIPLSLSSISAQADLLTSDDSIEAYEDNAPRLKRELKKQGIEWGAPVFFRIFKQQSRVELWLEKDSVFTRFRSYPICEMSGNLGPKLKQGDEQAPEGFYSVNQDWMWPFSSFHLAFNIRYPNAYDAAHGRTGNSIMVHGGCSSSGCFAMTDDKIEEIYVLAEAALKNGQDTFQVHVFPFPLTDENLAKYSKSRWHDFWQSLKPGYDYFEHHKRPPAVWVTEKAYQFGDVIPEDIAQMIADEEAAVAATKADDDDD